MNRQVMGKERLVAFIDAVIAIIITILVLKLEKPRTFDLQGLWELRTNFFAYGLFFFWLGAMWTNFHSSSQVVEKISQKTVWTAIIMLFFSSFFPYTTKLVASNFNNATMQVFYGVIVLLISFSVLWYYHTLVEVNQTAEIEQLNISRLHWMKWDIAIKILGIILSLTIFPAAEIVSVLITLCALVIPNQFRL